jgi:hypothetical protein
MYNGSQGPGLYEQAANGAAEPKLVLPGRDKGLPIIPTGFSRDGHFLIYTDRDPKTKAGI